MKINSLLSKSDIFLLGVSIIDQSMTKSTGIFHIIAVLCILLIYPAMGHAQASTDEARFLADPIRNIHLCYQPNPAINCSSLDSDAFELYEKEPNAARLGRALAIILLSKITAVGPTVQCSGASCTKVLTTRCETDDPRRLALLHNRMSDARGAVKIWSDIIADPPATVLSNRVDQGPPRDYGFRNRSNKDMLVGFFTSFRMEGPAPLVVHASAGYTTSCSREENVELGVSVNVFQARALPR